MPHIFRPYISLPQSKISMEGTTAHTHKTHIHRHSYTYTHIHIKAAQSILSTLRMLPNARIMSVKCNYHKTDDARHEHSLTRLPAASSPPEPRRESISNYFNLMSRCALLPPVWTRVSAPPTSLRNEEEVERLGPYWSWDTSERGREEEGGWEGVVSPVGLRASQSHTSGLITYQLIVGGVRCGWGEVSPGMGSGLNGFYVRVTH